MANKRVTLQVDPKFFKNIFEKERKKLEMKEGIRISQPKFTEFLAKSNVKFQYPKMNKKVFMDKNMFPKIKKSKGRFLI